jgi:hypothetical protein
VRLIPAAALGPISAFCQVIAGIGGYRTVESELRRRCSSPPGRCRRGFAASPELFVGDVLEQGGRATDVVGVAERPTRRKRSVAGPAAEEV